MAISHFISYFNLEKRLTQAFFKQMILPKPSCFNSYLLWFSTSNSLNYHLFKHSFFKNSILNFTFNSVIFSPFLSPSHPQTRLNYSQKSILYHPIHNQVSSKQLFSHSNSFYKGIPIKYSIFLQPPEYTPKKNFQSKHF